MDYVRYLSSKRSVDDRSINVKVLRGFCQILESDKADRLRIVEVGAGIGAMLVRLWRANAFHSYAAVEYTLIDVKTDVLVEARALIQLELGRAGLQSADPKPNVDPLAPGAMKWSKSISGSDAIHHSPGYGGISTIPHSAIDDLIMSSADAESLALAASSDSQQFLPNLRVRFVVDDALVFLKLQEQRGHYDAVVAAAVLDLFDLRPALETMFGCLDQTRGLCAFYLPVNFDGVTSFKPSSAAGSLFDARVESRFHHEMGVDPSDGGRKAETGRRLFPLLVSAGATGIASGTSSWVVSPGPDRQYTGDERYFLGCVFDFVSDTLQRAVADDTEWSADGDDAAVYVSSRTRQIEEGELTYIAHNMDYCGRVTVS
jgi:hypothetical protein